MTKTAPCAALLLQVPMTIGNDDGDDDDYGDVTVLPVHACLLQSPARHNVCAG